MSKIFVAEDDVSIRSELAELLKNSGYEVDAPAEFDNVPGKILTSGADLVLLDINLPGANGQMILSELRKKTDTPVIMVTSRSGETDEMLSMTIGADDFITKPYNPMILLLRIQAVLKRTQGGRNETGSYRGLPVNTAKGSIGEGENEQILTKNEMIIFSRLLANKGNIVTRDELMTVLWDNEEYINDNALTVNISRLRSKLAALGLEDALETRKKQGYILL